MAEDWFLPRLFRPDLGDPDEELGRFLEEEGRRSFNRLLEDETRRLTRPAPGGGFQVHVNPYLPPGAVFALTGGVKLSLEDEQTLEALPESAHDERTAIYVARAAEQGCLAFIAAPGAMPGGKP